MIKTAIINHQNIFVASLGSPAVKPGFLFLRLHARRLHPSRRQAPWPYRPRVLPPQPAMPRRGPTCRGQRSCPNRLAPPPPRGSHTHRVRATRRQPAPDAKIRLRYVQCHEHTVRHWISITLLSFLSSSGFFLGSTTLSTPCSTVAAIFSRSTSSGSSSVWWKVV